MMDYLLYYFIVINLIGLLIMKIDKSASKRKNASRISEKTLLFIALIGGSIGSIVGMYLFRHKTKKLKFRLGIPIMMIFQILVLLFVKSYL